MQTCTNIPFNPQNSIFEDEIVANTVIKKQNLKHFLIISIQFFFHVVMHRSARKLFRITEKIKSFSLMHEKRHAESMTSKAHASSKINTFYLNNYNEAFS